MTNRLTKKDKNGKYYTVATEMGICGKDINPITNWIEDLEERNFGKPIDKLGRLEDLEEQLGCPLDVVVKALLNGIYETYIDYGDNNSIKIRHRKVRGIGKYGLIVISTLCSYAECDETFVYKDYKKTWWLKENREE